MQLGYGSGLQVERYEKEKQGLVDENQGLAASLLDAKIAVCDLQEDSVGIFRFLFFQFC